MEQSKEELLKRRAKIEEERKKVEIMYWQLSGAIGLLDDLIDPDRKTTNGESNIS